MLADYDLVLFDCAPGIDQLTINALTAATHALIVTQTKRFSLDGLAQLLSTIDELREHHNPHLGIAGVIVNMHQERTTAGRDWAAELEAAAAARGLRLLTPYVPHKVVISDAVEAAVGLDEYGRREAQRLHELYQQFLALIQGANA